MTSLVNSPVAVLPTKDNLELEGRKGLVQRLAFVGTLMCWHTSRSKGQCSEHLWRVRRNLIEQVYMFRYWLFVRWSSRPRRLLGTSLPLEIVHPLLEKRSAQSDERHGSILAQKEGDCCTSVASRRHSPDQQWSADPSEPRPSTFAGSDSRKPSKILGRSPCSSVRPRDD